MATHGVEQRVRSADVVVVVFARPLDRFANRLEPGEVEHRVDRVRPKDMVQCVGIAHVRAMQLDLCTGSKFAHALECRGLRIREVIDDDEPAATGPGERHAGMRTDIAQPAGDQNRSAGHVPAATLRAVP